jgi:hypothetical protein
MIEIEMVFLLDTSEFIKEQQAVSMSMQHACYLLCYIQRNKTM